MRFRLIAFATIMIFLAACSTENANQLDNDNTNGNDEQHVGNNESDITNNDDATNSKRDNDNDPSSEKTQHEENHEENNDANNRAQNETESDSSDNFGNDETLASNTQIDTNEFEQVELPSEQAQGDSSNDQRSTDPNNPFPPRGQTVDHPDDILVLVNKENHLPPGYTPSDLMEPDVPFPFEEDLPQRLMRAEAAAALESLFEAVDNEGLNLFAQSGYRSYDRQRTIFASNVEQHGEAQANEFSARAGESEHQTGLAMDVTTQEVNFRLNTDFANTPEGQWVAENAADFGFIVRYERGKEHITGYQYEPWHLRYVGVEAAQEITEKGITLEEYLGAH